MKRRSTLSFSSKISQRPYGKRPQARPTISQPLGNTCREHAKGLVQFEMKILQGGPTRVLWNSSLVNELRQGTHPCVHVEIGKDRGRITRLAGGGRRYHDPVQGRLVGVVGELRDLISAIDDEAIRPGRDVQPLIVAIYLQTRRLIRGENRERSPICVCTGAEHAGIGEIGGFASGVFHLFQDHEWLGRQLCPRDDIQLQGIE